MINSYTEFLQKFSKHFLECWNGKEVASLAEKRLVQWPNQQQNNIPDADYFLARPYIQTVSDGQATLSSCVGNDPHKKHYKVVGFSIIDLFIPKHELNSYYKGLQIATLIKNHFRKGIPNNNINFREIRINEHEQENLCYRCSVVIEYEYYEYA